VEGLFIYKLKGRDKKYMIKKVYDKKIIKILDLLTPTILNKD